MLNPSRADAEQDDPTIRACSQFAKVWKYTQLNIVNLFAYRTVKPSELKLATNPIGAANDHHLLAATESAEQVILAWGNSGNLLARDKAVVELLSPHLSKLYYLKQNCSGQPSHPLYLKRTITPKPWNTLLHTNHPTKKRSSHD